MRRSPKAASSAPRSAWARTACGRCVEIQFADYFYPGLDQIVSEAARLRYRSGGEFTAPITVRMPCGGGIYGGQTHSQSPESLFTHVCGLTTVMPSNPYDAKGLLIASIEDDDPVIFLEPKRLYNGPFDGHHDRPVVPWSSIRWARCPKATTRCRSGRPRSVRAGSDVTVLAYGTMVYVSEAAAAETGIDAEIIDLRTLLPLDTRHDRRVGARRPGAASSCTRRRAPAASAPSLSAIVQEQCFYHLEAPIERVDRLGHAVPARAGMGLLPRARARRRSAAASDGGVR